MRAPENKLNLINKTKQQVQSPQMQTRTKLGPRKVRGAAKAPPQNTCWARKWDQHNYGRPRSLLALTAGLLAEETPNVAHRHRKRPPRPPPTNHRSSRSGKVASLARGSVRRSLQGKYIQILIYCLTGAASRCCCCWSMDTLDTGMAI